MIEILVVVAIVGISLAGLLGSFGFYLKITETIKKTTEANALAQDTIESVRSFRDNTDWGVNGLGVLATGLDYYPQKTGSPAQWILTPGTETINGFSRRVVFSAVRRNDSDNIVLEGGSLDPDTKKIEAFVGWEDKEVKITTYLTHWKR